MKITKSVFIILIVISGLSIPLFNFYCDNKMEEYLRRCTDFNSNGLRRFSYSSYSAWWEGDYTKDKIDQSICFSSKINKEFRGGPISIKWIGTFYAERNGSYKFYLKSDDGSYLFIDTKMVLDNGGIHPAIDTVSKEIFLHKGLHYICVYYFQHLGDAEIEFFWQPINAGIDKTIDLGNKFHPVNSLFNLERDESKFDKILSFRKNGNYFLPVIILLILSWYLNIVYFSFKKHKTTDTSAKFSITNRNNKIAYLINKYIVVNIDKAINIFILIDLLIIILIMLKGGIDLGISIFGVKLKVNNFENPVHLLLLFALLKIIINWGKLKIKTSIILQKLYLKIKTFSVAINKILDVAIALDLIIIFLLNFMGGIDLGISILGLKLKVTDFDRPVNVLLLLTILKITTSWQRFKISQKIKNTSLNIINICTNATFVKYTTFLIAGGIVILGTVLRISHYTSKAMWWDEVLVLITVKNRSFIDVVKQLSYSLHEPLYYLFVKMMFFFSRSDAVIKLPSLITGIVGIIALFYITRKLCDGKTALVSAYLLSISTVHIEHSQMLRMYTMVTLFSLLSTYMLFQFLNSEGNIKKMWGYIIFTALALNTHILSFTVFAGQIGYLVYCLIEDAIFKLYSSRKLLVGKFTLLLSSLMFALIDIKLMNFLSFTLKNAPTIGTISQKAIPLLSFLLFFVITSILISLLNVVIHYNTLHRDFIRKSFIKFAIFKKLLICFFLIFILCPSLNKSFFHFMFKHHTIDTKPIFLREPINLLIHDYEYNLTGQTGDWIFDIRKDKFFGSILFLLGIILAFFREKRWTILFVLHSISTFIFMAIIGYNQNSGSLVGERHFLLTLPPIILFVSIGMVWGTESIFNIFIYLLTLPAKIISNLKSRSYNNILRNKIYLLTRNIFTISLVLYILINSWDADYANMKNWWERREQDWFSYGKFVNDNLRYGILFFFPDQAMQHHASAYVNKEAEYLIFHTSNSSHDKRTVWVTNCFDSALPVFEALNKQGFKLILDTFSYGRIYEKEFPVKSPILISKAKKNDWIYYDDFAGYESADKNGYKFISDCYEINNLANRYSSLQPSASNETCSIIYKFIVSPHDSIKSLILNTHCTVGKESYIKLKISLDGINYKEILKLEESMPLFLDIAKNISGADFFYIKFELFSKRLPEDFVDALGKVGINDIQFHATFENKSKNI